MSQPKRNVGQRSWLADVSHACAESRFRDAATIYDANAGKTPSVEAALLGARAHIVESPSTVIELLLGLKIPVSNPREAAERDILLGEAFARTRDFESADERLGSALEVARGLRDRELVAEVGYRYVRRHLLQEDAAAARRFLDLARSGRSRAARLDALHAETFVLGHEEHVREQADRLIELLRAIDPSSTEFMHHRAWATQTLAILARELHIPEALPEIERQLGGTPWAPDFATNLFQTFKALGWAKALQGDYFNAFRHLKQASSVADTAAWKVVAACDRSTLARSVGEHRWSRLELDEAEQIATGVDWHATLGEERTGLLLMAELFGTLDSSRSAMYLARYRELGEIKSPLHHRHDARIAAFAQYSTGVVEIALDNKKRGLAELRQARQVFERFGYDFRVARCLVAEHGATGNPNLLALAAEKLRDYGQSWLAAELRGLGQQPGDVVLPPMQKKVFEELCQGKTTAEIANALGRSEFTISNHIKQIFKTFGVGSRSSLLAEAARRGMLKS